MKSMVASFLIALLFGLGLGVAGMTMPSKIIGFLDVTGNWDPSLLFVMIGAIAVHAISFRLIAKRSSPIFATKLYLPTRHDIDRDLVFGALIFGLGWGLGGFCPGPAIVASVTGKSSVIVFVASMIAGMFLFNFYKKWPVSRR